MRKQKMTAIEKFDDWMKSQSNLTNTMSHNQAWIIFLNHPIGKGFTYIKDYDTFCQFGKIAKEKYGYDIHAFPCSPKEFGTAVLNATPDIFGKMSPILPDEVKFALMAEKFHQWFKSQFNQKDAFVSYHVALQEFFQTEGVLEHIKTYTDFCQLAQTIKETYHYDLKNPPCTALMFYKILFAMPSPYYGEESISIPDELMTEILSEQSEMI